ncbi:hypothetical protein RTG_01170 [Rhodotorula toruloides ATCC 204091]|uniref:EthD domain-domain containing protein n=1 Tax=Rhodotorula toruloides TaxID=5286 RepID=A0A0K3C7K6_RHOTO|nr:hypothetical protein RTG_01170 [Rhodotorula toruloides ATCC 204091]KAK4331617.1 EthD domain-domain containing protein [Rhodotorula toruloides]PRQ78037.1 EthD domain-domain containing protein [Rhodotorula toruloides]
MVFVVLITVWRKPGMSPEAFYDHYENVHMPLIRRLAGDKIPISHNRLYVTREGPDLKERMVQEAECGEGISYDAVAELIFEDEAHNLAYWQTLYAPETNGALTEDEYKFMDRSKLRIVAIKNKELMIRNDFFPGKDDVNKYGFLPHGKFN